MRLLTVSGVAALLTVAAVSRLEACGPVHDWSPPVERRLLQVTPQAAAAFLAALESRLPRALGARDRIAVLVSGDDSPNARVAGATAVEALLSHLGRLLAGRGGAAFVPPGEVAAQLARSGLDGRAVFSPEVLSALARTHGATLFLKVRLVDYGSTIRLMSDRTPENRGLMSTQRFDTVQARVSLQTPDGQYWLIDELGASCAESFLHFSEADGAPVSFVEVYLERPGAAPFSWSASTGHRHFQL